MKFNGWMKNEGGRGGDEGGRSGDPYKDDHDRFDEPDEAPGFPKFLEETPGLPNFAYEGDHRVF